jgi:hypothetical protein
VAEQATGVVEGTGATDADIEPYDPAHLPHSSGRPISWVGTGIVVVGFTIGGISFPIANPAPQWVLFWIGTAIAIVGCLILAFSKAMNTDWY